MPCSYKRCKAISIHILFIHKQIHTHTHTHTQASNTSDFHVLLIANNIDPEQISLTLIDKEETVKLH